MDIENNKKEKHFKFHIGTKELISIVGLLGLVVITIKPDSFAIIIDKLYNLANTPGFMDFVSAITTTAIQSR